MELADRVAAVTGAASGIGRALAGELARRGCHVALADCDAEGLEETRRLVGPGVRASTRVLDVADRDAVHAWADAVVAEHGRANLVVNNAGVGLLATIADMAHEDLQWLMAIDFWGVVHGTEAFLPHLERAGEGHVVNVSSVFGIIAAPGNGAYNAAKFAVRGYTEALRMELELAGSPVSATCVHPGGIKTNIARASRVSERLRLAGGRDDVAARFDRAARTTPEKAARVILDAVVRRRRRVLVGADARVIDAIARLLPTGYQWLIARAARRQGVEL